MKYFCGTTTSSVKNNRLNVSQYDRHDSASGDRDEDLHGVVVMANDWIRDVAED